MRLGMATCDCQFVSWLTTLIDSTSGSSESQALGGAHRAVVVEQPT